MYYESLKSFVVQGLASGTFWGSIGALAGVAAAIAAFISISDSNETRREELESKRPYFVVRKPHFSQQDEQSLLLNVGIANEGTRPARRVIYKMDVLPVHRVENADEPEGKWFIETQHMFIHSSDLPRDAPYPWWLTYPVSTEIAPHYFKLTIEYRDAILDRQYSQAYFMYWEGGSKGLLTPDLVFANMQQANSIEAYLTAPSP